MRRCFAIFFIIAITALAGLTTACSSKSARHRPVIASAPVDTQKFAAKAFDAIKTKVPLDEDRRANAYIICVAEEVIRDVHGDWEIAIFQQRSPYLFVLPGRKIGVNNGIIQVTRNQHQLAALIAHSLAHVSAHHLDKRLIAELGSSSPSDPMRVVERPGSSEGQAIFKALGIERNGSGIMPFDALQESEANALGLELMARAGFNPKESLTVWRALEANPAARSNGMVALHPSYGKRSAEFEAQMERALSLQQEALASRKKPDCDRVRR